MKVMKQIKKSLSLLLAFAFVFTMLPLNVFAADDTLTASLAEAKAYVDGITINNSSNDPATVVSTFKTHFTWDNEKRENSKSYLFDWSYYNGVVFEGLEYVYEVTGEDVYKDYVIEYMSSLINSNGGWATCSNNSSKQCAGYNSTHGADCYKTASLLMDAYEMTGDNRYLTMAATLYADLDSAANSYLLKNAGYNYRHTWASDPSPDLWLDGLYMILPFRAEYAAYIGDTEELDLIVDRMQWVSDNMYNASKGLFYHAADSASSNSGTYWLRSIGWYAAAIVDIMDSMSGSNLEAMKAQLVKLVDGMQAVQNSSNGMWLNNMNASQSSSNPYETSGTALVCYAVIKAVNEGWLDESYADMAILAFNGICSEKLSGSTLTDICFKGAPGSSNSTFYDNEGKGVGPFIMFYAEMLEYVDSNSGSDVEEPEAPVEPETPEVPEEPEEPEIPEEPEVSGGAYVLDTDGIDVGEKYIIVGSSNNYALTWNGSSIGTVAVNVDGDTVTVDDPSVCEFYFANNSAENNTYLLTQDGSKTVYHMGGNMYYGNDNKGYWYVKNASNGEYQVYDYDNMNWFLNYGYVWASQSVSRFAVSSNTRTVRLYKYVDAHEHTYETVTVNATCTVDGSVTYTCPCGDSYVETIKATGHSYNSVVTASTCTAQGYTTHTCSACGDNYVDSYTAITAHTYKAVTVNATCTVDGSVTYTCACGDNYVETIKASGHNYNSVVTAPTCTAQGYTTHTCSACGDSYVDSYTAIVAHNYEAVTVDATCTENGSVTYTCSSCGDSYSETIEAKGHNYTSVVTAPTCATQGYTTYTCAACGDSYTANTVAALGHSYEVKTVEATCTEGGYTISTCKNCGESSTSNETAALGHTYVTEVVEATCETAGYCKHTCSVCGDNYISDEIAALGHNNVSVVTEATCETAGYTTHTCSICGETTVDSHVEALGHAYETVTVAATCTEKGSVSSTCSRCDAYHYETIEALGHAYTSVVTKPTCEAIGYTTHTCSACGHVSEDTYIAALGHSYETVTVEATCTEVGSVTTTCANCGDSTVEVIDALGHDYKETITDATCEGAGFTTHTCANCDDSYVTDEVAALGHNYASIVTAATCTAQGYTTHTCASCGNSYTDSYTNALGHSYSSVESDGYMVYTCANCGDSYSEELETKLTYTKVSSLSGNNDYVVTFYTGGKYYALSHANNRISVVQVTVSNGEITSEITDDMIWTYSDSKLSYETNGTTYYLYASSSWGGWWNWWGSTTLSISSSNSSNVSFSSNKLKVGSNYLRYSNGSVSLSSNKSSTTYAFIEG